MQGDMVTPRAAEGETEFRVLVVDDVSLFARSIAEALKRRGLACDVADCAARALELAARRTYQAILLDQRLPDQEGIKIIPLLLGRQGRCSLVVMTAYENIPDAIEAIRQGAEDYIVKEASPQFILERVLEIRRRFEIHRQRSDWHEHRSQGLLGNSRLVARVREQLEKVAAQAETIVLITGETGVGKEVAARYLHQLTRPQQPFIAVDCVALPANLVESILFGHERGSFTGAEKTTHGVFQEAGNGTVLLDEIGDMDLALQGKLLRVLETRTFQRIGSVQPISINARVVAATHRDLGQLVEQGRFRQDLYQRISVFPVHLPSLRERGDDVLLLAQHFLDFFARKMGLSAFPLSKKMQQCMLAYDYPGNVRELKNIIERAVILAGGEALEPKHLPDRVLVQGVGETGGRSVAAADSIEFVPGIDSLESFEQKLIRHALSRSGNVRRDAARLLGISRFQLRRRMLKYGLETSAEADVEEMDGSEEED